ncbi:MAG: DUF4384 domain-containing protein [Candidatus Eiseniibacteriota bacterium]|nr:MAG: DUF4384 domain-containing protein [Candidatus Eisenbacteria bacterium]
MRRNAIAAILSAALLLGLASCASAIETEGAQIDRGRDVYQRSPLVIDVWTNRGEGAIYYPGERIRVYFRASRDCYVTLYNIDTQGYVHLLYPARPFESHFVMGGVTYRIPSRRDPYDLIVGGLHGVEYIEAVASVEPFHSRIPWYLDPEYGDWQDWDEDPWSLFGDDYEYYAEDYDYFVDRGMVRGDPFLGIQRINSRMIPDDYPSWYYATAYTSFYVGRRVSYPRYVCYDCHWYHRGFDPYGRGCVVFDIRIDRTWVYSPRIVIRDHRPRYYYRLKETAPVKYKGGRHFWSSKDGYRVLKKEFSPVKPSSGPPKINIPDSGKEKYLRDWGSSGLKQWKSGRAPTEGKAQSLRQKLEREGVLKSRPETKEPVRESKPSRSEKEVKSKKPEASKKEVKPTEQKEKKKPSYQKKSTPRVKQTGGDDKEDNSAKATKSKKSIKNSKGSKNTQGTKNTEGNEKSKKEKESTNRKTRKA